MMLPPTNLLDQAHRRRVNTNWRHAAPSTPLLPRNIADLNQAHTAVQSYRDKLFASSKVRLALMITAIIVIVQLCIINHYMSSSSLLALKRHSSAKADLLYKYLWFCHSFPHLSRIQNLAEQHEVELVIVDPDLLSIISEDSQDKNEIEFSDGNYKSHQGPSYQKSIIHLAAINETSGGQPNLKSFFKALKNNNYSMLKYEDESQTMPHEVYTRMSHQFDDVQADALRDLNHLEKPVDKVALQPKIQISKIYTEFISHIFLLNITGATSTALLGKCNGHKGLAIEKSFIVIHIFVLYNYEYEPDRKWIQSSLHLTEIERHKLLGHGVHSIDFKVLLDHYYIQPKRQTVVLRDTGLHVGKLEAPFNMYKLFEPKSYRLLEYANNTYLHCKPSSFNISALINGNRKMSDYLKLLNAVQTLQDDEFRSNLLEQLQSAFNFMRVFSRTYGNFSFWLTGSSLFGYHKFCDLIALPPEQQLRKYAAETYQSGVDEIIDSSKEALINLEIGLFADELKPSTLEDLSKAGTIGVTILSDWRKPNSHIAFLMKDCPNMIFHLYLYELQRDFYQYYFITKDNLTFNHKLRRKIATAREKLPRSSVVGHHVFGINNLRLCWTRIDRLQPFKVPCDVHDHLRRIYVI